VNSSQLSDTGLALGDFLTGKPSQFSSSRLCRVVPRRRLYRHYLRNLRLFHGRDSGFAMGAYIPPYTKYLQTEFSIRRCSTKVSRTVFPMPRRFPVAGDPGGPDSKSIVTHDWRIFHRALDWRSIRKAMALWWEGGVWALFFDYPNSTAYGDLQNTAPTGATLRLSNPPAFRQSMAWQPGGNPLPLTLASTPFHLRYFTFPVNPKRLTSISGI